MQRKTNLMLLLIIGAISLIGMISCKKTIEQCHYIKIKYINKSSKDLQIVSYQGAVTKTTSLESNNQLTGTVELNSGSVADGFAFPYESDSLLILYNDKKTIWHLSDTTCRNPLLLQNYETLSESDKTETLVFTFVESDFDLEALIR